MQIANPLDPFHPGDAATGSAVAEHAAAMKELNPKRPVTPPAAPSTSMKPAAVDKINPKAKYGDKPGEQRFDTSEWTKGLPTYHKGVASVPKTGLAVLKKGEKVVKAEDNPDNPDNAVDEAFDGDKDDKKMSEHSPAEKAHFHRAMSKLHAGALHRHFGIPEGEPIPMVKKQEAANSDNPHVAAMGRMAVAMHGWKHKK